MEMASRSSRSFPEEYEDDEDEFGRIDCSFQKVELSGKNADQHKPSTPRSKHSATEQRRRCKINDRFQILRDLIPHSDQKRDKASFLLEVIEYIRFLQENVQKYESSPEMPWVKTFFRSLWKNAQNSTQGSGDDISDSQLAMKNGPAHDGYMFSVNDNNMSISPEVPSNMQSLEPSNMQSLEPSNMQNPTDSDTNFYASVGRGTGFTQPQQRLISDTNNIASQSQFHWHQRHSPVECIVSSDMLDEQEELTMDEGTVSVSNTYSQGLLATLAQSLESSGLQASISVQIILGKRAKRPTTTTSSAKEYDDPLSNQVMGHSVVGSSGEESAQALKRHRSDIS